MTEEKNSKLEDMPEEHAQQASQGAEMKIMKVSLKYMEERMKKLLTDGETRLQEKHNLKR